MKFLIENESKKLVCPLCGRDNFEYEKIDYPFTHLSCTTCGAVVKLKKSVKEIKED